MSDKSSTWLKSEEFDKLVDDALKKSFKNIGDPTASAPTS